jgi:hypothetical protein
MRVEYLSESDHDDPPPPYRSGEAGHAWLGPDGVFETDTRVWLSANSTHALLGHGVIDELNRLPIDGRIGEAPPVLIPPATLDAAQALFYRADRKTYGAEYEFVAGRREGESPVEYRIRIVNREYQVTLTRLAYLASTASREGKAVWMRIAERQDRAAR